MTFIIDGSNGLTFPNSTTQVSAGQVLQVVSVTYGTQVSTSSGTMATTGLNASITPKFNTSKILVMVNVQGVYSQGTANASNYSLYKNGSLLQKMADTAGYSSAGNADVGSVSICHLDSPATTSSTNYSVWFNRSTGAATMYMNNGNCGSTITLMEIAG